MKTASLTKTIVAVGDTMPGGKLADFLKNGDLVVGNLECSITDREQFRSGQLRNLKMPMALAPLLSTFSGVPLANNHILDFGLEGLIDTIKELNDLGVKHCGAGPNLGETAQAQYLMSLFPGRYSHTLMGITRKSEAVAAHGLGNFVFYNIHTKDIDKVR